MLRKTHSSSSRRKFLHQSSPSHDQHSNSLVRPPLSQPYRHFKHDGKTLRSRYESTFLNDKAIVDFVGGVSRAQSAAIVTQLHLPKPILHNFEQLRLLLRSKSELSIEAEGCLQTLTRKIGEVCQQLEQVCHINDRLRTRLHASEEEIKLMGQELKKQQEISEHLKHQSKRTKPAYSQFELVLQNSKLKKLNEELIVKLSKIQSSSNSLAADDSKQGAKMGSGTSDYDTEILRCNSRISYLEMKLKSSESKEMTLCSANEQITNELEQKQLFIDQLKKDNMKLIECMSEWRERVMMQQEDVELKASRQNFLLFSIKKLREINRNLTQKMISQGSAEGKLKKQTLEVNPYFHYEVDFFKSLRGVYFQNKFKDYKISLQKEANTGEALSKEEEYVSYRKNEMVNLTLLTYPRPSFFTFVEESNLADLNQARAKSGGLVSRLFIQALRGIMNSKTNEFMTLSQEKFTRFPEFLFAWFQKFYFNTERNCVCALELYMVWSKGENGYVRLSEAQLQHSFGCCFNIAFESFSYNLINKFLFSKNLFLNKFFTVT